jgi:hypothetical protein
LAVAGRRQPRRRSVSASIVRIIIRSCSRTPPARLRRTVTRQSNCGGHLDVASVMIDYEWTKRLSVYAGVAYSEVFGGLAAGTLAKNELDPMIGAKLRF